MIINTGKHKFKTILSELKTLFKNVQKQKKKEHYNILFVNNNI